MLPFQTFKKTAKGRERDKAHQVSFVLERRPNPYQSPFKFKHLIETHRNTWEMPTSIFIGVGWKTKRIMGTESSCYNAHCGPKDQ